MEVANKETVKRDVQAITLDKVKTKKSAPPKIKTQTLKPGDVIKRDMQGLFYPYVNNTGVEFISPTNGEFPGRQKLSSIINQVNNSPGITTIIISGTLCHGNAETSERVRASFYTGLMKLEKILHNLGLSKKVNVIVDYNNTKAKKVSETTNDADCAEIKFKLK